MKAIKLLLSNWSSLISICNTNIENGIDVEFYQSQKEKALAGYDEADKLFYKELATNNEPETENGSYKADEDTRRFEQQESQYLIDIEND